MVVVVVGCFLGDGSCFTGAGGGVGCFAGGGDDCFSGVCGVGRFSGDAGGGGGCQC